MILSSVARGELVNTGDPITREKDDIESKPKDKRAKHVYLKPKIKTLYKPMQEIGEGLMDRLLEGLSQKEREQFSNHLILLKQNCRNILGED